MVKVVINLKALGLKPEELGALMTGESVERKKPWPDIYLKGAEALGVEPARVHRGGGRSQRNPCRPCGRNARS